jgi:hypothetical protein
MDTIPHLGEIACTAGVCDPAPEQKLPPAWGRKIPAKSWAVFGKENPDGTTKEEVAEPSSLRSFTKGAWRYTRGLAQNNSILCKS